MSADTDMLALADDLHELLETAVKGGCPDLPEGSLCYEMAYVLVAKGWRHTEEPLGGDDNA